ncbi:hypothetical protein DFH09DRAFT_1157108 [Mycena vulgaris]|nr:hypothetical protein DFH09DRAFT_1157108 [Mycena vulgaris]
MYFTRSVLALAVAAPGLSITLTKRCESTNAGISTGLRSARDALHVWSSASTSLALMHLRLESTRLSHTDRGRSTVQCLLCLDGRFN